MIDGSILLNQPVTSKEFGIFEAGIDLFPESFEDLLLVPCGDKAYSINTIVGIPGPTKIYIKNEYAKNITDASFSKFRANDYKIIATKDRNPCLIISGFVFIIQKSYYSGCESSLSLVYGHYMAYRKRGENIFFKNGKEYGVVFSNNFNSDIPISVRNYIIKTSSIYNNDYHLVFKKEPSNAYKRINIRPSSSGQYVPAQVTKESILTDKLELCSVNKRGIYAEELSSVFDLSNDERIRNTILPLEE